MNELRNYDAWKTSGYAEPSGITCLKCGYDDCDYSICSGIATIKCPDCGHKFEQNLYD